MVGLGLLQLRTMIANVSNNTSPLVFMLPWIGCFGNEQSPLAEKGVLCWHQRYWKVIFSSFPQRSTASGRHVSSFLAWLWCFEWAGTSSHPSNLSHKLFPISKNNLDNKP
jgi:hypothetical protein